MIRKLRNQPYVPKVGAKKEEKSILQNRLINKITPEDRFKKSFPESLPNNFFTTIAYSDLLKRSGYRMY
jgi:hypothetical protein